MTITNGKREKECNNASIFIKDADRKRQRLNSEQDEGQSTSNDNENENESENRDDSNQNWAPRRRDVRTSRAQLTDSEPSPTESNEPNAELTGEFDAISLTAFDFPSINTMT